MGFLALQAALGGVRSLPPSVTVSPASLTIAGTSASQTTGAAAGTVSNGQAPFTYSWSQVSGGAFTINSPTAASTTFTASSLLAAGETRVAAFHLLVTDALGRTVTSSNVSVSVQRYATLTASVTPATVSGSGSTATATSNSATCTAGGGSGGYTYAWVYVSGSAAVSAVSPSAASSSFRATTLTAGQTLSAIYRCDVTDTTTGAVVSSSNVSVSVSRYAALSVNVAPATLSASGSTTAITTASSATATPSGGSGSFSYAWAKTSGGAITAVSATSAASKFRASSISAGQTITATFKCTVTDNVTGATAFDTVSITINNTASGGGAYSPAAGSYSAVDSNGEGFGTDFSISSTSSVPWTFSYTGNTPFFSNAGGSALSSGGSSTQLNIGLSAAASVDKSSTVTVSSGGNSWTINLYATATNGCPTIDTPILISADRVSKPAGEITDGEFIYTQHETTLEWGLFRVLRAIIVPDQDVSVIDIDGKRLRATPEHRVFVGGAWRTIESLGAVPDGVAVIVKMTVEDAHTMVTNGILSHNIKAGG